ncbi:hypothetical protein [Cohnella zeiphila]|uniref:Uncharacterized protein n=1 Tax=Cohnella zeiphila TaxID=2761120 RepID=A0A7X0W0X5_9BACL|nr:hypothetical protein [Cohnella zeiphila]MBB6735518.1 hypothetical protein [Cohnella zeiphila]
MSKLAGNGRWESKMLLTEHQEQYDKRKESKPSGRPTTEELEMIRDLIMLPYMLTVSEKGLQDVRSTSNTFRGMFERLVQWMMDRISRELSLLRRELSRRNIKVFSDETYDGVIYHRYVCRGYEDKFGIVRETLRSEMIARLNRYGAEFFRSREWTAEETKEKESKEKDGKPKE